jgi:hypothetical protein
LSENRYLNLRSGGITFVFKYESDQPGMLHIFARHLKEPDDAIYIFFNGETSWNSAQGLWETILDSEGLWWYWIDESKKVMMVVSCFDEYCR